MLVIRDANSSDDEAMLRLLKELQEHERQFEPSHRPGEQMAPEYLPYLKKECHERDGRLYVADLDGSVVGLLCVWREEQLDEYLSQGFEVAYISGIIVSSAHRKQGIGARLMAEAEKYGHARNISMIKIGSLARNYFAKELYRKLGYRDYSIQLIKDIRRESDNK